MPLRLRVKSVDVRGAEDKVRKASEAAMGVTAENVLSDCTPFVPYDTGALQGSGQSEAKGEKGYVEWGTDGETAQYARIQYYGSHDHGTAQNAIHAPKAQDHWFEGAKAERGDAWAEMHAAEMRRHLS